MMKLRLESEDMLTNGRALGIVIFRNQYILCTIRILHYMVRRMTAVITQIESVVTPSSNSSRVVVPKAWIGKKPK